MSRTWTLLISSVLAVATLAACTPGEPEFSDDDRVRAADRTPEPAEPGEDGEAPSGEVLAVTAVDIAFTEEELTAGAGTVTVELTNEGRILHDFTIEELGDELVAEADPGQTGTGTVSLDPGSYTYYCSVPGHRSAGMEGTLTVS